MNETAAPFRISPLPLEFARRVRAEMKDDDGHPLFVRHDASPHQCRACLELSKPGEGVLLVSFTPFVSDHPYAETGPVFIHERACTPYEKERVYPPEFPRHEVVLRAYNEKEEIEAAERVGSREVEEVISELLANPRVATLHARNTTYGCFMFRIDRA